MKEKPNYFAVIVAEVRYSKKLTPNAKLLYAEITALAKKDGSCWASNKYFSELYNVSTVTVSRWISSLVDNSFIIRKIVYKKGTKQIDKRYLQLNQEGINNNDKTPINKIVKDNNTSINNTSIIKEKIIKKKNFIVPTVIEINDYCCLRDNGIDADQFYDFYQSKGWLVGKNKMKDWKAAIRNWERNRTTSKKGMSKIHSHLQKNMNVKQKLKQKYETN